MTVYEAEMPVTDLGRTVRQVLRNELVGIDWRVRMERAPHLACAADFTPERALDELAERAKSHRINTHPLLTHMAEHGLPTEIAQLLLSNYYVNNRVFHLHIAAQSLSTPLSMRGEMYENLVDELGNGEFEQAHPNLFMHSFDTIGRPDTIRPQPESLALLNTKILYTFLSGDYRYGVGGLGFIELSMPDQMRKILSGLRRSGLSEPDLIFWDLHITIDEAHGESWFDEMRVFVDSPDRAQKTLEGGMALLDARAGMFDGVWAAMQQERPVLAAVSG